MLLFTFDPNRDLTFHPLISSNLLWRKRRLVSHLIVSGKFPLSLSLSFSLIIDLLSPLHSKATTRLFPGPIVIYMSILFSSRSRLLSPSFRLLILHCLLLPHRLSTRRSCCLLSSHHFPRSYISLYSLAFGDISYISFTISRIYWQLCDASYIVYLLLLHETFIGSKLFMLVRSELNLDLKNIKQEQENFWKQHPALVKMELLIQAHLNRESASLSPSLHVDFTHVLELAQRLYFFFLLTTNQCPKWRIYVASSTTIVVALLVISIKNTDGGDKWLSPCSGWFHSICLRMTHCQTINGLFCGIKRVDVSFDGGKSWVEASRCHKPGIPYISDDERCDK
ncbi:hypothetical protein F8388_024558 [Cannabis sativa]|uniref:Uncharacterized protein n=1 Tax=Cannabis sativa TaxID=3483 RepID=A0A7J6GBD9_CANSA|nr:hypothetical protein F8388_024558 [Cannabis sativa]